MKQITFVALLGLILIGSQNAKALSPETCDARGYRDFLYERNTSQDGFAPAFDFTETESCVTPANVCQTFNWTETGWQGFYDTHQVYAILLDGKVLFASTSQFFEQTYGSIMGSATALIDRDAAFQKLISKTGCQRIEF